MSLLAGISLMSEYYRLSYCIKYQKFIINRDIIADISIEITVYHIFIKYIFILLLILSSFNL
ncbi:hypothetical protein C5748_05645 [Phyllobacterium phragmitis]|uniref:Uncharacterized protein n=1 Tax=Phyllobacterium phragmitis TaxID=2670329 RepID=A0A2S9IWF6_9HYPH|nr:hypothetical protein C5748_05645 [Phyllobacterium phragmitis]